MRKVAKALRELRAEGVPWIYNRIRHRFFRIALRVCRFFGCATVRSAYGIQLAANYSDATFKFYATGGYGYFYWNRISSINYQFVFLDIGANQGLYAIGAAQNRHSVCCYAFEPVPATYRLLMRNIALNGAEGKCISFCKAVADREGRAEIAINQDHSGAATLAESNNVVSSNKIIIETIDGNRLNEIVRNDGIPILVKIDVEGYERVVIEQLFKTDFAQQIREIFFEVDERWVDVAEINSLLCRNGFAELQKIGDGCHYDVLACRSC